MKSKFLTDKHKYDGSQLISLRNYLVHGLLGDSIVAWIGPCDVTPEHMVDGEDLLQNARIAGDEMLHFIVEKFDCTLLAAVALQRLLASLIKDELKRADLHRDGDDIFLGTRKLSISIATQSPISSLIHFAINVTNEGTPVETVSLRDLQVTPETFARQVFTRFCREVESITQATQKVRWVK